MEWWAVEWWAVEWWDVVHYRGWLDNKEKFVYKKKSLYIIVDGRANIKASLNHQ